VTKQWGGGSLRSALNCLIPSSGPVGIALLAALQVEFEFKLLAMPLLKNHPIDTMFPSY
jgi:hypothetical protein